MIKLCTLDSWRALFYLLSCLISWFTLSFVWQAQLFWKRCIWSLSGPFGAGHPGLTAGPLNQRRLWKWIKLPWTIMRNSWGGTFVPGISFVVSWLQPLLLISQINKQFFVPTRLNIPNFSQILKVTQKILCGLLYWMSMENHLLSFSTGFTQRFLNCWCCFEAICVLPFTLVIGISIILLLVFTWVIGIGIETGSSSQIVLENFEHLLGWHCLQLSTGSLYSYFLPNTGLSFPSTGLAALSVVLRTRCCKPDDMGLQLFESL